MELDQLRYFLRIAETKSFTRAADQLIVSQPALSRSVQRLEEELGVPLFVRKSRVVELSDAGVKLKLRAEQILALVDDIKTQLTDDGQTGRIRIGAIPTVAPYFLPTFLRRFANQFPHATTEVYEDTTKDLLHQIGQGEIDFGILALPINAKYIEVESLFEEELFLALPRHHKLCEKAQIRLKDLEHIPFVMLDEPHCLSTTILSYCHSRSLQPVVVGRTNQLSTVQELVSLNHGVSMVPRMAQRLDHAKTRVYRSLSGPLLTRTIAVAWDPYRYHSRLVKSALESLREHCQSLEDAK